MSLTLARLGAIAASFPIATAGDFESIATVTVGAGGASSIEFTSIPGAYQHLQIRGLVKSVATSADGQWWRLQANGDTGSNYNAHYLRGNGSNVAAGSFSETVSRLGVAVRSSSPDVFSAFAIDILDYVNTSKNTTVRNFGGEDRNGSGYIWVTSGLWRNTSAITSLKFSIILENFAEHSTLALYGIKAP